jgi:hypothetical protein
LALLGFDCQAANRPHSPYDQPVVLWQHWVREILVRGVTSTCWLSLWDRVLQGTRSISYLGLP